MRLLQHHTLLSFIFLIPLVVSAQQHTITGKIVDTEKYPIDFSNVVLLNNDNFESGYTITDSLGIFRLNADKGTYHLLIEQFGEELYRKEIQLNQDLDLGIIEVNPSVMLEGIVIEGRRKTIEQKIDRLVYNIGNDPLSKTLTTEELIKRVPLLRIRDNNVSIVGKGAVNVSVNGKLQQISSSELVSFLNNFDPSMLKSIEVITTPPANFSAQGNAGIINIVTTQKMNTEENWSASVRSAYIQRSLPGTSNGISFNYNKNKFSASANVNYTLTQLNVDLESKGNDIEEITDRKDKGNQFGGYLNLNYRPSEKHDISTSFNVFNSVNENNYTNKRVATSTFLTDGNRKNEHTRYAADLNYIYKIDTLGKTITAFTSYNANLPTEKFNTATTEQGTTVTDYLNNLGEQSYKAFSAQLDFHFPYKVGELDYGVQYYTLKNDATIDYKLNGNGNSESFLYDEKNYALYASFATKDIGKFRFKGGLRYEYNNVNLKNQNNNNNFPERKKGNLFPSFYAIYNMENGDKLSVNYSRRINRPEFSTVTPFRWYNNPYSYETGNPYILPYTSDNIQLNYSKGDFMISAYAQFVKNGYGSVDIFENNEWIYTYENYLDQDRYGITASYFLYELKWLETDLFTTFYQNNLKSKVDYIEDKTGYGFSYQINNNIFLDQDKKYILLVNYWQDLPFWDNNIYNHSFGSLDIGANISLLDKKLNIGLLVTDIANQSITRTRAEFTNYSVHRREYFDARSYRISLRYNFGSSSVKSVKSTDKFNERERMN